MSRKLRSCKRHVSRNALWRLEPGSGCKRICTIFKFVVICVHIVTVHNHGLIITI